MSQDIEKKTADKVLRDYSDNSEAAQAEHTRLLANLKVEVIEAACTEV